MKPRQSGPGAEVSLGEQRGPVSRPVHRGGLRARACGYALPELLSYRALRETAGETDLAVEVSSERDKTITGESHDWKG